MAGSPSYKENLERHYKVLLDKLELRPVMEIMVAKGKIKGTDRRFISTAADEKHERSIFLDILLDKEDDSVDIFVAALYETGQDHLASVMEGKDKEERMTQEHLNLLRQNRYMLIRDMDCSFMLECLQSDSMFTVEDAHTVNACLTLSSKNSCLLDILTRKTDAAFTSLVHGLRRSGQNHLADLLKAQASPPEQSRAYRQRSPPEEEKVIWQFQEMIGKGGFGSVFKCLHTDNKQTYAVKVIETGGTAMESEHLQRIKNEVDILSRLKHPRIVQYIDAWTDTKQMKLYLAIEYMAKGPLEQYIQQHHPLKEDQVGCFTAQILEGLVFLHDKKIIHRDIKGSNILMDGEGRLKIADFGTARALQSLTTCATYRPDSSTKTTVGTFYWMAPEVFDEEVTYTYSADIWSLGCTVVEMFTRYPPSHKLSQQQLLMKLSKKEQPKYKIEQKISKYVEDFLKLCFQIQPKVRKSAVNLLLHPFCASYKAAASRGVCLQQPSLERTMDTQMDQLFQWEYMEDPEPVELNNFIDHVKRYHKDADLLFSVEYKLMKNKTERLHPWKASELEANRPKNRYTNILPYDHSRVKLLPTDDEEDGDYINANYMPGYNSRREFIATQGPLPGTVYDFWRMIWEQNVTMIIMLSRCMDRGKPTCEQYWPKDDEPHFIGDLQIQIRSESILNNYTIRVMDVKLGSNSRQIKQFHFTTWPDFGCPKTTNCLLDFVSQVRRQIKPDMKGPIVVHCRNGAGRTGIFIAVDRLLQHIRDYTVIDIYHQILEMREHRCNMVLDEDQYMYIHDCLRDAIECPK